MIYKKVTIKSICFIIILSLIGCSSSPIIRGYKWQYEPTKHTREDIKKLFVIYQGMWWNYYKRGKTFMRGGYWEDAINDLEKAISMLRNDQWSAMTYGVNRIDYFPNRELGISYYNDGQLENAIRCLKTSLDATQTSRAQYYLKKILQKTVTPGAVLPPSIEILSHKDGDTVGYHIIRLAIKLTDKSYIDSVWINGEQMFTEIGERSFTFEENIKLKEGVNQIVVTSSNMAGKRSSKAVTIKFVQQVKNKKGIWDDVRKYAGFRFDSIVKPVLLATTDDTIFVKNFVLALNSNRIELESLISEIESPPEGKMDLPVDIDALLPPKDRYRVLLLPFANKKPRKKLNEISYLDDIIFDKLQTAIKVDKRFKYVDYNKRELQGAMGKQKLSNRNFGDPDSEVFKIDKVVDVIKGIYKDKKIDGVLVGNIDEPYDAGEENLVEIKMYLYDIKDTDKYVLVEDITRDIKDSSGIVEMADKLVMKIKKDFPLSDGRVETVEGDKLTSSLMNIHRVRPKMKLVLFKDTDYSELNSKGQIIAVNLKSAVASITNKGYKDINIGDIVITK